MSVRVDHAARAITPVVCISRLGGCFGYYRFVLKRIAGIKHGKLRNSPIVRQKIKHMNLNCSSKMQFFVLIL